MPQKIEAIFSKIFSAYDDKDFNTCINLARQVIMIDEHNIHAINMIALSSYMAGKYADAINNIICVLSHDINHHGAVSNFCSIIKGSLVKFKDSNNIKEKREIIFACYNAVNFASLHNDVLNIEFSFPILIEYMIIIGYKQEAVNLARLSFKINSSSQIGVLSTFNLINFGITDEECLKKSADIGIKSIRKKEYAPYAFCSVLFWCYWREKYKSMEFFLREMEKTIDINTIINSKQLHTWYMTKVDESFYKDILYKFNIDIQYQQEEYASHTDSKGVIFICVDENYWNRFSKDLAQDLLLEGTVFSVHVCIMNPSQETQNILTELKKDYSRFGYSTVNINNQPWISDTNKNMLYKTYYACNRFMMMNDILGAYQIPIISLDGDQIPIGDMDEFVERSLLEHDGDVAIHYGTRLGPGLEMVCDLAIFRPAPSTHLLFSIVSKYMAYFFSKGYALWMLDQVSFYAVLKFLQISGMAPRLSHIKLEQFPFDRYLFHPLDSVDKDAAIHAKRAARARKGREQEALLPAHREHPLPA